MKKKRRASAIMALSAATAICSAQDTITFNGQLDNSGGWIGGVFSLTSNTGITGTTVQAGDTFFTFCVELDEFIGSGTYEVQANTSAISGSGQRGADTDSNPNDGMDELDFRTAYLYSTYLADAMNDSDTARAIQLAIWGIEEDIDVQTYNLNGIDQGIRDSASAFLTEAWDAVYGPGATWGQTWGNVRILNIGGAGTNWAKQDMLVIIPLPNAGALAGLGLLGLAVRRRRRLG